MALDKVAFLPFGLVIDQWRWKVFSGEVPPTRYKAAWWELRRKYQGVDAPAARTEADFDPGAKYHVPANVPYMRYFLAAILQFQFHRAACREAGFTGPLHQCSIYANKEVGAKLDKMLAMGQSRPWPEALYAMTGERQIDATAALAATALAAAPSAWAQKPIPEAVRMMEPHRLRIGDVVRVWATAEGPSIEGAVVAVSSTTLTLTGREEAVLVD